METKLKTKNFEKSLIEELKNFDEAKAYLLNAVEEDDEEFLLDAMQLIVKAFGPTEFAKMAGGSKQLWSSLRNPTYSTMVKFLKTFNLKLAPQEIDKAVS